MKRLLLITGIVMGMAGSGRADTGSDALIACALADASAMEFSGVVAVSRRGTVSTLARGATAETGSAPITAATRFNLGSASKMFTAVAVAQLVESGRLSWVDPIGKHLDGLPPELAAVTVRQLLTHSGGLGNFFTPDALPALQRVTKTSELRALIAGDEPRFTPGSRFEYSNNGFVLLGLLVERLSGSDYEAYLAKHVFAPAGMSSTGALRPVAELAVGMTEGGPMLRGGPPGGGPIRRGPPPGAPGGAGPEESRRPPPPGGRAPERRPAPEAALAATPAGGMFSTVEDMTRFFVALKAGSLVTAPTRDALTAQQIESAPARGELPALYHGLGFGVGRFEGHRWFGHNGGAPGINAEAIMFPDDDLIVVVLANRDPPAATEVFRALRKRLLGPAQPCQATRPATS